MLEVADYLKLDW